MFEYKGKRYTLETMQKSAVSQGYDDFDEFMQMYKDDGMIEVSVAKPSVQKLSLGGFEPVVSSSEQPERTTEEPHFSFFGVDYRSDGTVIKKGDYNSNPEIRQRANTFSDVVDANISEASMPLQSIVGLYKGLFGDPSQELEIEEADKYKDHIFLDFFHGIGKAAKVDWTRSEGVQAGLDIGSAISQGRAPEGDDLKELYENDLKIAAMGQTDEQRAYGQVYEANKKKYGGVTAWFMAIGENPTFLTQSTAGSMANQIGSFLQSPTTLTKGLAGGTTAAVANRFMGGPIGTAAAFLSGLYGTVSGSMEQSYTFVELMKEQLEAEGKDFNPENIRELLSDDEIITFKDPRFEFMDITGTRAEIMRSRATRRGIAIGFTDFATGALVGKGSSFAAPIAGGLTSEVLGQTAGGQEYDAGEILTEGFAEKAGPLVGVGVTRDAYNKIKNPPKYSVNGHVMKKRLFDKVISRMNDLDIAMADIKIDNDNETKSKLYKRQQNAIDVSQVDAKIKDPAKRKEMVKLGRQLTKAEADAKKTGWRTVPGAKAKVLALKAKIETFANEAAKIDGRTKDVRAIAKIKEMVGQARDKIKLQETEAFLKKSGEQIDLNPYQSFKSTKDFAKGVVNYLMKQKKYDFDGIKVDTTKMSDEQIAEETQRIIDSASKGAGAVNLGNTIYVNREAAVKYNQLDVGSHEILHSVLRGALATMKIPARKKMIAEFKQEISDNLGAKVLDKIDTRLREAYTDKKGKLTIDLETTDEWFTALSDVIESKKNNITYDNSKSFFDNMKDMIPDIFKKETDYENLSIATGKQAFEFMKEYSKSVKKGGLSERMVAFTKGKKIPPKKKEGGVAFSKSNLQSMLDTQYEGSARKMGRDAVSVDPDGNRLTKPDLTKSRLGQDIAAMVENITQRLYDPIIETRGLTRGEYKNALIGVASEIITTENFDPTKQTLDKFVSSRLYLRANALATKLGVPKEFTKDIDNIKEPTTDDIDITPITKKAEPKGQRARVLKSLADVNLDNKEIISATARAEIDALIEQNPKNLEEQITKIIEKEITKAVKAQMGKISNIKGEVVISDEYKAFIALNYENIVESLDVNTIKNNYKTLFELTEIGKEDRKTRKADKPSLKKDSNYRKGIFKIETNKAKFTKFFTEGGYTTLLARQKGLANQIAKGIVENVVSNEIIENSNDNNAIIDAKLKSFANKINKQKNEVIGNYADQIKFSKSKAAKDVNDGVFLSDQIVKNGGPGGIYKNGVFPPRLIKNPRKISYEMQEFVFNEIYADGNLAEFSAKELKAIATAKILQKVGKTYANINNGAIYEQFIIDVAKNIPGITVLSETMAEGGIPDLHVQLHGKDFFVEVKMANAQYSSITISDYDIAKGKWQIKKQYEFNDQINALVKKASKGVKAAQKFINDQKILDPKTGEPFVWKMFGQPIPTVAIQMLKDAGLYNGMMAVDSFDINNIGEMYRGKEYPVHYIHIQGKGLFHMGKNPLGLPVPQLTGDATITLRRVPSTQYRVAKESDNLKGGIFNKDGSKKNVRTGYTTLTYRAIPIINAKSVPISIHGIGNNLTFNELVETKEVEALKYSKSKADNKVLSNAVSFSRSTNNESKGITVLDFDDTLATTKSLVKYTRPDGTTGTLNAEEYASTYEDLLDKGYTFDFSDFNKVVKGKIAPLFQKALKLQKKFGPENMFILTARPMAAQKAIFDFLKANGLNISMKNITGLGNSTAEAKALWVADKVGEGFNDFYFADDALQNTQAVKNMLDQFDVKSKVQQAKVKFSKSMNKDFNDILENVTDIESKKRFSAVKARKRGESKGKFRFFIPPSHEDFVGLLYNFIGKGKEGNKHRDFFEKALIRPLNRAYRELNTAKQSIANDYKSLNKQFKDVSKKLTKKIKDSDFTNQDAIRVYLWDKHGNKIPGLSPTDQQKLVDLVMSDSELQTYAETLNVISKQETYVKPTENWEVGDIRTDLDDATGRVGRAQYFSEFTDNTDIIFSEENLNKIEAAYGEDVRSALEDSLYRTKTGRNRPSGQNKLTNRFLNYLNGSVASTMFVNVRSALLQQMSIVNFINYSDNNVFTAAKAFANLPQYFADWAMLFNSDYMKQRRGGIKTDVNGAELAASLKGAKNTPRALLGKLLEKGFILTQIGDNVAIATGGAPFYRNRVNTYLKQGLSKKEAESKAFIDFQKLSEETQQSARPDMVSQQQASPLGKVILAFQNVTSQFNRIGKKAFLDIKNRRISPEYKNSSNPQLQSDMSNLSRIGYYFAMQNLIFYSLQTALFAAMFDDDEDDEKLLKKKERVINGSIDSVLRGTGVMGAVVATLKNMAIKFSEQREKGYNKDESAVLMEMLNVSPPLGIKARKLVNAEKTLNYNKSIINEMGTFDIDNPLWSAVTNVIEATTNAPVNRMYNKTQNTRNSLDNQYTAFQRALFFSGYTTWSLNLGDTQKMKDIKEKAKSKKKGLGRFKKKTFKQKSFN